MAQQPGFHGPTSNFKRVANPGAVRSKVAGAEKAKNSSMDYVRQSRAASKPTDGQLPMRATSTARIPGAPAPSYQAHSAVQANNRQFGGASQAIKGAVSKLRVAKRLGGLLRRGR